MVEDVKDQNSESGTTTESGSVESQEEKVEVKHDASYLTERLVETAAEAKKYREELKKYKAREKDSEREKLADQGKWKELAETAQSQAKETETKLQEIQSRYARKAVMAQFESEAAKMGCVDFEVIEKLLPLSDLEVDEDFNVDKNQVKAMLELQQKKRPFLFDKKAPRLADGTPAPNQNFKKELKDLTYEEKRALLRHKLAEQVQ